MLLITFGVQRAQVLEVESLVPLAPRVPVVEGGAVGRWLALGGTSFLTVLTDLPSALAVISCHDSYSMPDYSLNWYSSNPFTSP